MFNEQAIKKLVDFINTKNNISDKDELFNLVKKEFNLTEEKPVLFNDDFAIRFGWNGKTDSCNVGNTVLGLKRIREFDNRPLIFCVVTRFNNYLLLINSSFINKVSHSSKNLRNDNIVGSINGSDIMKSYNGLDNIPKNFSELYNSHLTYSFEENLDRLVINTNNIMGKIPKFNVHAKNEKIIIDSINRAKKFAESDNFTDLYNDLNKRVNKVKKEISIAAFIENVNLRGRIIEFLVGDNDASLKEAVSSHLLNGTVLPKFTTKDSLGDYSKKFPSFNTETDIKTKVLFLKGNPKAYNIDKLLKYLSDKKTIFNIFLIGIDDKDVIRTRLLSFLDKRLLDATKIQDHWAGRNTRGVTQFYGSNLNEILEEDNSVIIDDKQASDFLYSLISL